LIVIILIILFISLGLSTILIFVNTFIAKKIIQEREKPSAFECGFDPKRSSRVPFSLRFYLIAVIFLIFDVEITLIIPLPIIIEETLKLPISFIATFFIIILVIGLYHE